MRLRPFLTRGLILGLLLLFLVAPQGALAASDAYYTKESFWLAPGGSVVVEAAFHDVEVLQTADPTIEVEVNMRFQASSKRKVERLIAEYKPVFTVNDDRLQIRSRPHSSGTSSLVTEASGKIKVTVPAGINLEVNTASGNCRFHGRFGAAITTNTASGTVSFQGETESFSAKTASGKIQAGFERPVLWVDANSASGSLWVSGPVRNAALHTVSGAIDFYGRDGGKLDASTVSGNLTASWETLTAPVTLTAESVTGNLRFFWPTGTKVNGEIRSRTGRIKSDYPGVKANQENALFLQEEGAAVQVTASTVSGNIELRARNRSALQPTTAETLTSWHDHAWSFPLKKPAPKAFLHLYRYEKRWAPGLKFHIHDRLYLTGNIEYSYQERDLNLLMGGVYFLNSPSSWFAFYGGGGVQLSNEHCYKYPYLIVGTDFLFLFYELVYPWTSEVTPQHRFGWSISF